MSRGALATLRRRLLGLALVVFVVGGVTLSIALYNKSFSSFVTVTLKAGNVGNQLIRQSDVKVRGLIVGSVQNISATVDGADLTLALDPESAKLIPENVSARFLPKTLFGERFVSLEIPDGASGRTLRQGDVIPQDRTMPAVELDQALEHLMPVLQAVQPQKLSSTLTAISTALQGRGKPLGETLSELGQYVGELNPHLPQLQTNLRELAKFSDNLNAAAPDLVQSLDNLTTTTRTVVDQRGNLQNLYGDLTGASQDLQSFLHANSSNLIALADTARPTAELLAEYSPEYPCFLGQMSELVDKLNVVFGKGTDKPGLHATLEVTANRGQYKPGVDDPQYQDKRGPRCYDMQQFPLPFPQGPPEGWPKDGSSVPPVARSMNDGLNPANNSANVGGYNGGGAPSGNPAYTSAEHGLLAQLVGPQVGIDPAEVPGWTGLLVGPLYRGAEVTVK
ncbi:MCE family protein [Amycolatopsis nigrescens]|uniref:MCE family protein n=1 Tax=Amycolatopsis nigrescens TaxID=381445 RepID=UPI0003784B96|nr:MCE family protein [Amycolatopsis nigrescens]